jgi:hypothetical protein
VSARGPDPPAGRLLSWLVTAVLVGWFVVYNIFRVGGDSPRGAAWISLGIGAVAGILVFGCVYLVLRRSAPGSLRHQTVEIPGPDALDAGQRAAVRIAVPLLAALAAVALVMGIVIGVDWIQSATSLRSHVTKLILAIWDLFIGGWIASELPRLHRYDVEGIDSIALGCVLTAVLAGVGISHEDVVIGQAILILVAGLAGIASQLAVWRLTRSRWALLMALAVAVVAALSLSLPLAL